jgi:2'-5' RNA ligase
MAEVRSFVAVPLPQELQARVATAIEELAPELPAIKWSRKSENLHVTVKFLGAVDEEKLAALGAAFETAMATVPRFRIELRAVGTFPSARHAKVVWVGIDDVDSGLQRVAVTVETVAAGFGFTTEARPFTGHVTVGRAQARRNDRSSRGVDAEAALAKFAARSFGATVVDEVHIYESRLGRDGSTYILRSRASLGPAVFN